MPKMCGIGGKVWLEVGNGCRWIGEGEWSGYK